MLATMLLALAAQSVSGTCHAEKIAGTPGENHVLYRGVSPDGRTLAVGWDRKAGERTERGAYLLDLRTRVRRDLPGLNNAASYSPDGRFLVTANYPGEPLLKTEIVEYDLRTGQLRPLASHTAMEWLPSYSRDGKWVLFNSFRSGASDLYRVNRASGAVEQLTDDPRYEAHSQGSRDGRSVMFHRQLAGDDYGLVVLDLRTRETTELPGTAQEEAYPAWSPDNRWIAYSHDGGQAKGKTDLYVMRSDGSGKVRLTSDADKEAYATWSPDGRWLYFVRFGETESAIYRLRMRGGQCLPTRT